jgi:tetratricopeptide (TPR) repeat protein
MVLIEALGTAGDNCIVITGAGSNDVNGVYIPTGRKWHDAEVYENDAKCLLSREPHKNQKTGETSYGWIIGQERKPIYAVQSPDITPPSSGWRKFTGALPLPVLSGPCSYSEGAAQAAESFKNTGKTFFVACKYSDSEAVWTRALSLANASALKAALYSNRSEARLRLSKWDAALSDAQEALKLRPTHDKALLRAAVASREMKMYNEAYEFAKKCLENNSKHMEAKILLADLEYLIADLTQPDSAKVARLKLQESIKQQELEQLGKKLGTKDMNLLCGMKAFEGYGDRRAKTAAKDDRPPLTSLPYHHAGLPQEEVNRMDKFFQEQRDQKDFEKTKAQKEKESYAKVKEEYKARAAQDVAEGKLAGLDEIFGQKPGLTVPDIAASPPKEPSLALAAPQVKTEPAERISLTAAEMSEIDSLFEGLPTRTPPAAVVAPKPPSEKTKKLAQARKLMLGH